MKIHRFNKTAVCLGLIVSVLLLTVAAAPAEETKKNTEKPEWFFHDIVDVKFVMEQVNVPMPENVMIIDARPKRAQYDKGHIPMAVSIPNTHFDKMTDKLPKDKNALLVFYCGGLTCKLSHKSAQKAEALGYKNVKVFAEGFPGWMKEKGNFAAVSVDWVKKQLDDKADMVLVDSRPKRKQYDKGHIPTAISIPDMSFDKMTGELPSDKNKLLVFYCGGYKCKLSHKSAQRALELGYQNVKVFAGGYPEWKEEAKSSDTAAAKPTQTIKSGKEEGSIDIENFKQIMSQQPDTLYLVDVRDPDEFSKGTLKNAVNIPVEKLEGQIKNLPSDKAIVFVCGTGARSGESYYMVKDLRPELKSVYYIDAEMTFKSDGTYTIKKTAS